MSSPTVVALHLSEGSRRPLRPVPAVTARRGEGLAGDRARPPARTILFVEQEVLDHFGLAPGVVREQVTVRGLALGGLAPGGRVRIGTTVLEAGAPCAPCARMDEIRPGLCAALEGRRGRFFQVVEPGGFAVGDAIALLPPGRAPSE